MNPDKQARAAAALDAWFDHGPTGTRAPWWQPPTWDQPTLEQMHAALEAPDIDAAMAAFPGGEPWMTTPEQDAWNRETMSELRQALSEPEPVPPATRESPERGAEPPGAVARERDIDARAAEPEAAREPDLGGPAAEREAEL